jgi:glycosyltransferase involved in cell wall biosynthesis
MITLNEGHNIEGVLENLSGWAAAVRIVDSYSRDDTVGIALKHGATVVQRSFSSFGDQWNFAISGMPVETPWTMKLDPDERLSEELKSTLLRAMRSGDCDGYSMKRRLWFMGKPLPVAHSLVRLWKTGRCRFTNVAVNEHPIIDGALGSVVGEMRHFDSPDLDHWYEKQNRYSSAEAVVAVKGAPLADEPLFFGTAFQRRMWIKRHFAKFPLRYFVVFLYHFFIEGAWRAGWVGFVWSRLRSDVMRMRDYKVREMELTGRFPARREYGPGNPDPRVRQYTTGVE